jgi:hypothetical protein
MGLLLWQYATHSGVHWCDALAQKLWAIVGTPTWLGLFSVLHDEIAWGVKKNTD